MATRKVRFLHDSPVWLLVAELVLAAVISGFYISKAHHAAESTPVLVHHAVDTREVLPIPQPTERFSRENNGFDDSKSVTEEQDILSSLTPSGQDFFKQSMEVRKQYSETSPYKYFLRDRDSDGIIDYLDENGYLHLLPRGMDFYAYLNNKREFPIKDSSFFYRYVKDCASKKTIERQIIYLTSGYPNITLSDRFEEQCIRDGSFDVYYLESASPLE